MNYLLQAQSGGNAFPIIVTITVFSLLGYGIYKLDQFKKRKKEERLREMSQLELQDQILKKSHVYIFWALGVHHFVVGKWYIGIPYLLTILWGWIFLWTPLFIIGVMILACSFCWAILDLFLLNRVVTKRNRLVYSLLDER